MTFGIYIKTIKSSKMMSTKSQPDLVRELFKVAGSVEPMTYVSDSLIRKWLNGTRSINTLSYFPKETIEYSNFISYFRVRISHYNKWERLQKSFGSINDKDIVKCDTPNMEEFYQSLLRQFLVLLKLPVPEDLDKAIKPATNDNSQYPNVDGDGINTPAGELLQEIAPEGDSPSKNVIPDQIQELSKKLDQLLQEKNIAQKDIPNYQKNEIEVVAHNEMREIFKKIREDCSIGVFVNNTGILNRDSISKVDEFSRNITSEIIGIRKKYNPDQGEEIYEHINEFIGVLKEYKDFLCSYIRPDNDNGTNWRITAKDPKEEMDISAMDIRYRMRIDSLHFAICGCSILLTGPIDIINSDENDSDHEIDDLYG